MGLSVRLTIHRAETFVSRLVGLLGRAPLQAGEALYLAPCASVHTCFMRYAIDVVFVDAQQRVLKIVTLAPWRAAACRGAKGVVELRAGEAVRMGLVVGQAAQLRRWLS